jgi:hypothetical protein
MDVTREQLATALDHLWVYAKNHEGTRYGQITDPGQVADELWENLRIVTRAASSADPDVVDAHLCLKPEARPVWAGRWSRAVADQLLTTARCEADGCDWRARRG